MKTRWPRISLKLAMLAITALSVVLAYGIHLYRAAERLEADVQALEQLGGRVEFSYQLKNYGADSVSPGTGAWVPEWLRERVGRTFLREANCAALGDPNDSAWKPGDDAAMKQMVHDFPHLRQVTLWRTDVTNRGLAELEQVPDMHYLRLWRNKAINDEGMISVQKLHQLHTLEIYGPYITDAGLKHLSDLPNLKELLIIDPGLGITDEGLKHLANLASLTMLSLDGADAITDEGLRHLARLANLKELNIESAKVTTEGLTWLRSSLPHCRISNE